MADEIVSTEVAEVEAPESVETTTEETPVEESAQGTEETTEQVEGEESPVVDPNAPQIPYAKIKAQIERLKTEDPQAAKELKNLYFEVQAIRQAAPGGVPQIKKALETVEAIGGEEGVQKIQAERAEWSQIDEKFAAGDATVLDTFAKFNPEGFAKIVPGALDKLSGMDRAAYDKALAPIFVSTLDNMRYLDTLERLYETLGQIPGENGQPKFAREMGMLQTLAKGYDDLRKLATAAPKKDINPELQKLEAERAKFNAEQSKAHSEYVGSETARYALGKYETLIGAEAKAQGMKLETMKDSPAYQRMINEIDQEIAREISKDKASLDKIRAAIATGKRGDAVKLSNARFDAVSPKAVQKVVREWAGMLNPARPARKGVLGTGAKPVPAGVKKLDTQPTPSQMKQYPGWREDFMVGKGELASGQRVIW